MKVTVIGSHLCPDTLYALNRLVEAKADIDFKNLSASLSDLKAYLALRESSRFWADSIRYRYRNKQRPPESRRALCCR